MDVEKHPSIMKLTEVFKHYAAIGNIEDNDANGEKCQSYQGD
jgi:hypothetical protein